MQIGKFISIKDLFWGAYRRAYIQLSWLTGLRLPRVRLPQVVGIELTNKCNMGCPHCHRTIEGRSEGFMSFQVFRRLVDDLTQQHFAMLRIVGLGEPALHPELPRFMDYLQGTGIKVEFTTNGELLHRYSPEQICQWPIDILGISIDGTDQDSYHKLRPGGEFQPLEAAVRRFHQYKLNSRTKTPHVKIRNVVVPGTNHQRLDDYARNWLRYSDSVTFNTYIPPSGRKNTDRFERCNSLFFLAHVRWDGRVPLCGYQFLYSPQEYIGNLVTQSLEEIWQSPRLAQMQRIHLGRTLDQAPFCQRCFNTQCNKRIGRNARQLNVSRSRLVNAIQRFVGIL